MARAAASHQPTYPDIEVRLSGEDGNAFNLIVQAARTILDAEGPEAASEFATAAMQSESYDALLRLLMQTVNVT